MAHFAMTHSVGAHSHALTAKSIRHEPLVANGPDEILKLKPLLLELCDRCGQDGWEDLRYFFDLPYGRNKRSQLVLVTDRPGLTLANIGAKDLVAAALVHEYLVKGVRTGIYLTDDFAARRNVIGPPELRGEAVRLISRTLLRRGATLVYLSYSDPVSASVPKAAPEECGLLFKSQRREVFSYLRLLETLDETLATLGKRTRSHMRYYRRRAERELGCYFVADASMSAQEFLQFNRDCAFATTDELASIRYRALGKEPNSFLSGIRADDGRWLSMVGGYKTRESVEVYWQMNLASLPDYSLSTVMRSFLMEHEIANGRKRLLIEGGTPHPMHAYFVRDTVSALLVMRRSVYGGLIRLAARSGPLKKNLIAQVLNDQELRWQRW